MPRGVSDKHVRFKNFCIILLILDTTCTRVRGMSMQCRCPWSVRTLHTRGDQSVHASQVHSSHISQTKQPTQCIHLHTYVAVVNGMARRCKIVTVLCEYVGLMYWDVNGYDSGTISIVHFLQSERVTNLQILSDYNGLS